MTVNELLTDLLRRIAQYFNLKKNPYCKYKKNSQKNGKIWINKVSVWY